MLSWTPVRMMTTLTMRVSIKPKNIFQICTDTYTTKSVTIDKILFYHSVILKMKIKYFQMFYIIILTFNLFIKAILCAFCKDFDIFWLILSLLLLQLQGKGTRKITTRHWSMKRREVLESTVEVEVFIMLVGGPVAVTVNRAQMIQMEPLHHQVWVMVSFRLASGHRNTNK